MTDRKAMDIEEMQRLKRKLARDIREVMRDFEETTGVEVSSLSFDRQRIISGRSEIVDVTIDVRL